MQSNFNNKSINLNSLLENPHYCLTTYVREIPLLSRIPTGKRSSGSIIRTRISGCISLPLVRADKNTKAYCYCGARPADNSRQWWAFRGIIVSGNLRKTFRR